MSDGDRVDSELAIQFVTPFTGGILQGWNPSVNSRPDYGRLALQTQLLAREKSGFSRKLGGTLGGPTAHRLDLVANLTPTAHASALDPALDF